MGEITYEGRSLEVVLAEVAGGADVYAQTRGPGESEPETVHLGTVTNVKVTAVAAGQEAAGQEAAGKAQAATPRVLTPRSAGVLLALASRQAPVPGLTHNGGRPITRPPRQGRNEPCACGSGKRYKKCCMGSGHG